MNFDGKLCAAGKNYAAKLPGKLTQEGYCCRNEAISANNPRFHFRANRATTVVYPPYLARKLLVRSPVAIVYLVIVASVEQYTIV